MGKEKRNILLVTYYFPPHKSVGARRWAKFAKYLQRKGHKVIIICAANPKDAQSPWDEDVVGLEIHTLPNNYPKILGENPKTIFGKIKYRLVLKYLKIRTTGTIYDQTVFWEKQLLNTAERLIKANDIDTVISNGPPFRLIYYCTKLKDLFPHIILVSDFRDPWTWWYNMGYPSLKGKDKSFEAVMERKVVELSDFTLIPNSVMQNLLHEKYPSRKDSIKVLPHAFDEDDYPTVKPMMQKRDKLNLLYYGTLYNGLEEEYRLLAKALMPFKDQVNIDIYTNIFDYEDVFETHGVGHAVNYHKTISMTEIVERVQAYDYIIIMSPEFGKDNISTKFFEIIKLRTPFLFVSEPGVASKFIQENKLGIHLKASQLESNFSDLVHRTYDFEYNVDYDVSPFSFDSQTDYLLSLVAEFESMG